MVRLPCYNQRMHFAHTRRTGQSSLEETIKKVAPCVKERFQRGLQRALSTPPQHRTKLTPKPKERPASKGRVHKGKTRN
jgi:hypothetical protein